MQREALHCPVICSCAYGWKVDDRRAQNDVQRCWGFCTLQRRPDPAHQSQCICCILPTDTGCTILLNPSQWTITSHIDFSTCKAT